MEKYYQIAKTYVAEHKKEFVTGVSAVAGIAIIILGLALYSYNTSAPAIVYEPANACDLLTLDEAKELMGNETINGVASTPVQSGAITTSKCSYSNGKVETDTAIVAAIIVRSGINDAGISLNKAQFESGIPSDDTVEVVKNVGDEAYYNKALGQLNVLKQSTWIVISYGLGSAPASNTLDDALKLADKVLN